MRYLDFLLNFSVCSNSQFTVAGNPVAFNFCKISQVLQVHLLLKPKGKKRKNSKITFTKHNTNL